MQPRDERPDHYTQLGIQEAAEAEAHREYLLAQLRVACLRCKVMDAELTSIGVALRSNMIGADTAVAWAREQGVLWLIEPLPGTVGAIALQVAGGK